MATVVRSFPTLGRTQINTASGGMTISIEGLKEVQQAIKRFSDAGQVTRTVKGVWQKEAKTTVRNKIRTSVRRSFRGKRKLASSYSAAASGTHLFNLRLDVYSRLKMARAHEFGPLAPIRAKHGKLLAIPTRFAQNISPEMEKGIKRRGSRTRRLRPKHLFPSRTFLLERNGKKIIMMKIDQEKGSMMRKAQTSMFRKAKESIKNRTAVPMFVLQKDVVLRKRTRVRFDFRRDVLPLVVDRTTKALRAEFVRPA